MLVTEQSECNRSDEGADVGKISRFLRKFLPQDLFSQYETVIIPDGKRVETNKYFAGGPGECQFEFICRQESTFAVKIGKAVAKTPKFQGIPTDTKFLTGKNVSHKIRLSGTNFGLKPRDRWLVKVRVHSFAESARENILDIYVTDGEG